MKEVLGLLKELIIFCGARVDDYESADIFRLEELGKAIAESKHTPKELESKLAWCQDD